MTIRAFVGHSFNDKDADVVTRFLRYFDQLAGTAIDFSWEHAERAEPRVLAEKVAALMTDKNLLIAICTAKEAAVQQELLHPTLFGFAYGKQTDFQLKTSDWVIQEIAYACQRRSKNASVGRSDNASGVAGRRLRLGCLAGFGDQAWAVSPG